MNSDTTRFLFLSNMCDEHNESKVLAISKVGLQTGMITFSRALIKSIETATESSVTILNCVPIGWYPKYSRRMILKTCQWRHLHDRDTNDSEIGYINLPLIKEFTKYLVVKKKIEKWLKAGEQCNNIVIVHGLSYGFIRACSEIKNTQNRFQFRTCIVNGDLPGKFTYSSTDPYLERLGRNRMLDRALSYSRQFDKSIFVTEGIAEITKPEHGYIIIDNITDIQQPHLDCAEDLSNRNIVLYTGALNQAYGVLNLIDSFEMIDGAYELWIVGDGELKSEVEVRMSRDPRIKYFGFLEKKSVADLQIKATVLVNPRKSNNEFTRYSFPSKTTEYMASGVPMIGYKLEGIGEEYYQYLNSPLDESNEALAEKIRYICKLSKDERYRIGKAARDFIIREKSCLPQGKKIIDYVCN